MLPNPLLTTSTTKDTRNPPRIFTVNNFVCCLKYKAPALCLFCFSSKITLSLYFIYTKYCIRCEHITQLWREKQMCFENSN